MEQMRYNLLFRWFIGLAIGDAVWDHSVFSKNRDRLLEHEVVEAFFTEVMSLADKRGLLSREHFSMDGTLIQAWASHKSFRAKVSEQVILSGHFEATRSRFAASGGPVLILQDTTEFSYKRERPELIGSTRKVPSRPDKKRQSPKHTVCEILMHSSLAVTTQGIPLGLAAIKFWSRKKFKGCDALKRKINPTRVPIEEKESYRWLENLRQSTALFGEPNRCVHVGDRESDIYELFCLAHELQTNFLVRTALIGSREMETTRSHMRWMKHVLRMCIRSLSVTRTARLSGLCWNFDTAA